MKRSRINVVLRDFQQMLDAHRFPLPPFAMWTPERFRERRSDASEILARGLGWDVTDFGAGRFDDVGLALFTLRNGRIEDLRAGTGEVYAEKIMQVGVGQVTPMHFHWSKTEDIIHRGGGRLCLKLYRATHDESLSEDPVSVRIDGLLHSVPAGGVVSLASGQSITLPPRLYHTFWAEEDPVLAGEVSTVNDDHADNRFLEPIARFAEVEEDEARWRLLVSDYPEILGP